MEKKQTKKVAIVATAVTPKKKKKRYYPPKKVKVDGNLESAKIAEKATKQDVQPEPASFVWAEEKKPTWLQRVVAWFTSIGK
jgi:hypothetical protein